jgi:phage replication O-like protein O
LAGNPQVEDGYTRIANEIMEALAKYRIPGEQMQCLVHIFRMTYGWHKKTAVISLNDFANATGMHRANVSRALKSLKSRNMIGVVKSDDTSALSYSFNKKYKTWRVESKVTTVVRSDYKGVVKTDNPTLYKRKERYTPIVPKKIKKKKTTLPDNFELNDKLRDYALTKNILPEKLNELMESFKDYHIGRRTLMVEWDRAWYQWVRNAPQFSSWAVQQDGGLLDGLRDFQRRHKQVK